MGHWGSGAFDNDQSFFRLQQMTSTAGVRELIEEMETDSRDLHVDDTALAVAEVMAAALGGLQIEGLYQTQCATLMPLVMMGGDDKDGDLVRLREALGGDHYLPEEVELAIRNGQLSGFTQDEVDRVLALVELHCLEEDEEYGDPLANWSEPERRKRDVEAVIQRLQTMAAQALA